MCTTTQATCCLLGKWRGRRPPQHRIHTWTAGFDQRFFFGRPFDRSIQVGGLEARHTTLNRITPRSSGPSQHKQRAPLSTRRKASFLQQLLRPGTTASVVPPNPDTHEPARLHTLCRTRAWTRRSLRPALHAFVRTQPPQSRSIVPASARTRSIRGSESGRSSAAASIMHPGMVVLTHHLHPSHRAHTRTTGARHSGDAAAATDVGRRGRRGHQHQHQQSHRPAATGGGVFVAAAAAAAAAGRPGGPPWKQH